MLLAAKIKIGLSIYAHYPVLILNTPCHDNACRDIEMLRATYWAHLGALESKADAGAKIIESSN
jgi:hypothetical protein